MLRATIDRDDIPDAEQWQWDEWLISILRRDEEDLAGMMSASANLRSDVAEERERRTLAKAKKEHHITWAEIWAGHPAEAALRQMHPGWLESEEAAT